MAMYFWTSDVSVRCRGHGDEIIYSDWQVGEREGAWAAITDTIGLNYLLA
jgi:hypothetical protein